MSDLTPELQRAVDRGYAERDRDNMEPTIRYFQELLAAHLGHPVLTYELAGAYDTAGREAGARELYETALWLGLEGDTLRRCLCQCASTLRWLGRHDESLEILLRARRTFPESDAVRVFLALTLNELGQHDAAVAELLTIITNHAEVSDLGRYATGLAGLAQCSPAAVPATEETASVPHASLVTASRVPRLDHESAVEVGQGNLGDVHPEPLVGGHCAPGDLRLPHPPARVVLGRIDGRAVQCQPRIALQVRELSRVRHRPEGQLVSDLRLDTADPRRAVRPQRRHRLVLASLEQLPNARCELGGVRLDLVPCHHGGHAASRHRQSRQFSRL
jgi:hypothetical protein